MATNLNVMIDRNLYIGGSEISTIMGINKFAKRWDLLQLKAGYRESNFDGNEYTQYGDIMEGKIRDYINTLGISKTSFKEDTIIIDEPVISRRCNYDGLSRTHGLEIKTTSQIHSDVRDYKYYVIQLLWGMILGKRKKGVLAVYSRPSDFDETFDETRLQIFEIDIKDFKDWCDEIEQAVQQFKIDLAKLKENPFLSELDLLPKDIIELSTKIDVIENKLKEYYEIQEEYKNIKEQLVSAMQENNIKSWITPQNIKITLVDEIKDKEVEIKDYDEDKFIKENLELHEKYHNKLAEYLVIRKEIKKGKSAYLKITLPKD